MVASAAMNHEREGSPRGKKNGGRNWIRTSEGVSQQIYSLPPLATWVSYRPVHPVGRRTAILSQTLDLLVNRPALESQNRGCAVGELERRIGEQS